jgi:hypothetical protein
LIDGPTLIAYGTFFLNDPKSGLLVVSIRLLDDLLALSKLVDVTLCNFLTSDYFTKHVVSLACSLVYSLACSLTCLVLEI